MSRAGATAVSTDPQTTADRSLNQQITRTMYRSVAMHETPTGLGRTTVREGLVSTIELDSLLTGLPGGTALPSSRAQIDNTTITLLAGTPLPPGTVFSLADERLCATINPATGELTYSVGDLNGHGRVSLPILVTYPDDSTTRVAGPVQLNDLTPPASSPGEAGSSADGIIGVLVGLLALLGGVHS